MGDEWYTPKHLFDALDVVFDLDVATPCDDVIHTPVKRKFCKCDDGLNQEWSGFVWMNPPYSKPSPWVEKWLAHGNGLALLPMAKSKWFVELCNSDISFVVLPSTFKFVNNENQLMSLMMGSTLWAVGDFAVDVLKKANLGRLR